MKNHLVRVYNLSTGEHKDYTTTPEMAVVAAYAYYTLNDQETNGYAKYNDLVIVGETCVTCGDWCANRYEGQMQKEAVQAMWAKAPKLPRSQMLIGRWVQ